MKDHLGSTDVVTDQTGAVIERMSFDAWGKRRAIDWTALAGSASAAYTWQGQTITRGFTGHEQLDSVDLVHMNGRVYDPEIGRFLSADAYITDVTNSQALNAYTYVNNNPLSFTDPSGFFLKGLFHKIGNFFRKIGHAVGRVARSGIFRAIVQIIACAGPQAAVTCPLAAAGLTLAAGGSIKDALLAGAISFAQMGAYSFVGGVVRGIGAAAGTLASNVAKLAIHAAVGGAFSVAQGGSFETGAITGAISAGTSIAMEGLGLGSVRGPEGTIVRTAIAAVAGGTASVLAGGKFANGAITGAMSHLYNQEARPFQSMTNPFSKMGDIFAGVEQAGKEIGSAAADAVMYGGVAAGFASGAEELALAAAAARAGLGRSVGNAVALNARQAANLARFEGKLPVSNTGVFVDEIGENVMFTSSVPGNVPGSSAVYQKLVDDAGKTIGYWKTTFDPKGAIVSVKDKLVP